MCEEQSYTIAAVMELAVRRPEYEQALLGCLGEFGRLLMGARKEYLISPAMNTSTTSETVAVEKKAAFRPCMIMRKAYPDNISLIFISYRPAF